MGTSEVARIREQINQEIAASRLALTGYAEVARHDVIAHHYNNLGVCLEQLQAQIGAEAAIQVIVEALDRQS